MKPSINKRRYEKILEIGTIAPPLQGWSVRIHYVLQAMRESGLKCAALDVGLNRKTRREECDHVPSTFAYCWKVLYYLAAGYRIHNHLNGQSVKAYVLVFYSTVFSCLFLRSAVLTWHGGVSQEYFPRGRSRLADLTNKTIFRLSSAVICNAEKVKQKIVEYGVVQKRIFCLQAFSRQYLDFEPVMPTHEIALFTNHRGPKLFSYIAYRPEFSLEVLIAALENLLSSFPDLQVLIVGSSEVDEGVRRQFHNRGLQPHVQFTDNLDRATFLTLLASADLYIRTPSRDGVASSVLESLALGVPVVAAANDLRPPQVVQYNGLDACDLAAKVKHILELPANERRPIRPMIPDTVSQEVDILTGLVTSAD